MNRVLKMCLVWLLLIALPLQGFASATMFSCGIQSDHHGAATVSAAAVAPDRAPATAADGHCDPARHGPAASSDPAASAGAGDPGLHDCKSSCNACQACCVGAMLVTGFSVWKPAAAIPELPSATPQVFVSGHVPGGPERPPRAFIS